MLESRKRRSTGRTTIADVARLAGVGTMTVSRVLRTPDQVSSKLRERVDAAINQLGYIPNLAASSLASASSTTIAMVVPHLTELGCSEMFAGLQQIVQPAGYQILLAESQHQTEQEQQLLTTLSSYHLAALILLSVEPSVYSHQWLESLNIPLIEIGALQEHPLDMNIGIDHAAAMFQLTQYVISKGYQNIALLCANQEAWIFQQLLQGWHKALLQHHRAPHRVINTATPPSYSTGAQLLPEILSNWPETDALICTSDYLACGALYACQRWHIPVPRQLAVVGFGGHEIGEVCQPPLTTMIIPYREIGIQAGKALLHRLQSVNTQYSEPQQLPSLQCSLHERHTC